MPEISKEIQSLRSENSKTFDLGKGKRRLEAHIGAIHYKDNYDNSGEQWKDIDLTWEGNRITKAPYELTHGGNKLTLKNKRTGNITTIELDRIGGKKIPDVAWTRSKRLASAPEITNIDNVALDTDLEVVTGNSAVSFRRILKSDKAPQEAKFKVSGDTSLISVRASDEEGDIPIETSLKEGILTETLNPDRAIKYPVRIDPTWQVGQSSDDCFRRLLDAPAWSLTLPMLSAGHEDEDDKAFGGGMRFTNITIPRLSTINNGTHLTLKSYAGLGDPTCNTRISAEAVDDAPTFADNAAAFDARWANRTATRIDWDNIGVWLNNVWQDSPEIKTVIQEIVNRGGWASGQDMVIFWEDFEDRSSGQGIRQASSYNDVPADAPKLVIEYTPAVVAPTVTTYSATSVEETTATARGYVNDTGGENPNRYIDYDINSGEPYAYTKDCGVGGTGYFYGYLTLLTKGEKYYFRARAVNSGGTGTGSELTFITKPDAPSSLSATPVSSSQINLTWNKGTGAYYTYVRRKEGSYPTSYTDGDQVYTGTNSSKSDTGLDRKKTYYYRAWSRAYDGGWGPYSDGYSSDSATTFAEIPVVTAQAVDDIAATTATGNGTITDNGGENCSKRGVCWNTTGNPTVADSKSEETDSFGVGVFDRPMTGLTPGEHYYVKAYAYNSAGYGYSSQVEFTATQELTAAVISVASSVQSSSISGSGNAPLAGTFAQVASSVQQAVLAHAQQYLASSPVDVASSVRAASIAGTGIAPLTATVVSVASSIQPSALAGSGNAPLTAAVISVASSIQTSGIAATGEAPLVASPVAVASSIQQASISGVGVADLVASVVAVASSVVNAQVVTTQELAASPVAITASVQTASIAGTGTANLVSSPVAVASSIQVAVIVGSGEAPLTGTVVAVASSVNNAEVGFVLKASPVAVASSVQASSVAGLGTAPLTGTVVSVSSSVSQASIAGTGIAPLTGVAVSVTASVPQASVSGSGNAPLTGAIVGVISSVVNATLAGTGIAPLTGATIGVASSVVKAKLVFVLPAEPLTVVTGVSTASIAGSGEAPLMAAVVVVTSSIVKAKVGFILPAAPVAVASSVVLATISGSGEAPLTGVVVSIASAVQAASVAGTGIAPLTAAVVSVASSVQNSAIAGSGNAPLAGTVVDVASSVQQAALTAEGEAPLTASPVAVGSSVQAASVSGTGEAPLTVVAVAAAASIQNATLAGAGAAPLVSVPILVTSSIVAAVIAGSGAAPLTASSIAVNSSIQAALVYSLGRFLKVIAITSQYRGLEVVTAQNRLIKVTTAQKRQVKIITAL